MREELLQFSYEKLIHSAGFEEKLQQLKMELEIMETRRFFATCKPIKGMLLYLGEKEVQDGIIKISDNKLTCLQETLTCDAFTKYSGCELKAVMIYLITCSQESYEAYKEENMNYHFVQNTCMDMVREMLMQNFKMLTKKEYDKESELWFTREFGPGYYGMELSQGKKLHKILQGERIGVAYCGDMMHPLKSTIGVTLCYKEQKEVQLNPCDYCKSPNKNCLFCGELKK